MSEIHQEISAYIKAGSAKKLATAIIKQVEAEGMRLVKAAPIALSNVQSSKSNYWSVAVVPGRSGWQLMLAMPEALFCEQDISGSIRFTKLCESLKAPGFIQEVNDSIGDLESCGAVVLESDGLGQYAVSGYMSRDCADDDGDDGLSWNGLSIDPEASDAQVKLINGIFPRKWERDEEALRCELKRARQCGEYAQKLLGLDVSSYWKPESMGWHLFLEALRLGENLPVNDSIQLIFEWPALDRPYPTGPSKIEAERVEFWSKPQFLYEDGTEIKIGDEILIDGSEPASIINILNIRRGGKIRAFGVFVKGVKYSYFIERDFEPWSESKPAIFSTIKFISHSDKKIFRPVVAELEKLAVEGDPVTQCQLGYMYFLAGEVEYNPLRSNDWLRKAAKQGDAEAKYRWAKHIRSETGARNDPIKMGKLLEEAIKFGHEAAVVELVHVYEIYGKRNELISCLKTAADSDNRMAQYHLGFRYFFGQDIEMDYAKAASLFLKSADRGVALAQAMLGVCYQDGFGIKQDYERAAYWYKRAYKFIKGIPAGIEAVYRFGMICMAGLGMPRDEVLARQAFVSVANFNSDKPDSPDETIESIVKRAEEHIEQQRAYRRPRNMQN